MNPTKLLLFLLLTMLGFGACGSKKESPVEIAEALKDSVVVADTTETDSAKDSIEVPVPKRADELFDDFAFNFMRYRRFQRNRVAFPLRHLVDGNLTMMARKDWRFDRMYSKREVYTLIFDDKKGEAAAKDTSVARVVVEELNLDSQRAKSYFFLRENGEWKLTQLSEQAMQKSENSDFYEFYHQFATDEVYRKQHISKELVFTTESEEGGERIKGTIAPEQWDDFAPELPRSEITNILYGQSFKNSNLRVLSIRTLAGGMDCTLTFKRKKGRWMLTRLDN